MSLMDTIKSWFSKSEDKAHDHPHDHADAPAAASTEAPIPPAPAAGMPSDPAEADNEPPRSA